MMTNEVQCSLFQDEITPATSSRQNSTPAKNTVKNLSSLLTIDDLASLLSCTTKHIRNLVYRREIPFFKVGRLVRFDLEDIRSWLLARKEQAIR